MTYYTSAERALVEDPDTMDRICAHVGAGGSLEDLCAMWDKVENRPPGVIRFGAIWAWVCEDKGRFDKWLESNNVTAQADTARIKSTLRAIAFGDVRALLDDHGRVLPVKAWPADVAKMIGGMDVAEMFGKGDDQAVLEGIMKKIKLADRLKALELLAKIEGMLIEKREIKGKVTMEQLVAESGAD